MKLIGHFIFAAGVLLYGKTCVGADAKPWQDWSRAPVYQDRAVPEIHKVDERTDWLFRGDRISSQHQISESRRHPRDFALVKRSTNQPSEREHNNPDTHNIPSEINDQQGTQSKRAKAGKKKDKVSNSRVVRKASLLSKTKMRFEGKPKSQQQSIHQQEESLQQEPDSTTALDAEGEKRKSNRKPKRKQLDTKEYSAKYRKELKEFIKDASPEMQQLYEQRKEAHNAGSRAFMKTFRDQMKGWLQHGTPEEKEWAEEYFRVDRVVKASGNALYRAKTQDLSAELLERKKAIHQENLAAARAFKKKFRERNEKIYETGTEAEIARLDALKQQRRAKRLEASLPLRPQRRRMHFRGPNLSGLKWFQNSKEQKPENEKSRILRRPTKPTDQPNPTRNTEDALPPPPPPPEQKSEFSEQSINPIPLLWKQLAGAILGLGNSAMRVSERRSEYNQPGLASAPRLLRTSIRY